MFDVEALDDLPVLLALLQRHGLAAAVDEHFSPHGNWKGCSLGTLATVWLAHLLTQADHCAVHVQPWATTHLEVLRTGLGVPCVGLDFTDDRLAALLDYFAADARWEAFETATTQRLLRAYPLPAALPAACVRLDTTTASSYRSPDPQAGYFRFGNSKDHRPDLPQLKLLLATLDPLGLPLLSQILPGDRADDPLYLPALAQVRARLARSQVLYVADCKMGALGTRAQIAAAGDYYLVPLAARQYSPATLAAALVPVWEDPTRLVPLLAPPVAREPGDPAGPAADPLGQGFEGTCTRTAAWTDAAGGPQTHTWEERLLWVCSHAQAEAGRAALHARLARAQQQLADLNRRGPGRKRYPTEAPLLARAQKIAEKQQVSGLLQVTTVPVAGAAGKPPGDHQVVVTVDAAAVAAAVRLLGWRVFATNAPTERLSLAQAFWAYRGQYRIEDGFARLKGRSLALQPWYFTDEDRVRGLVRLLLLALQVLTWEQEGVRQAAAERAAPVRGIYPGNPLRKTRTPTVELLLRQFRGIARARLSPARVESPPERPPTGSVAPVEPHAGWHLANFTEQHRDLLELFHLNVEVYHRYAPG